MEAEGICTVHSGQGKGWVESKSIERGAFFIICTGPYCPVLMWLKPACQAGFDRFLGLISRFAQGKSGAHR